MACWDCATHDYLCAGYYRVGACACPCHAQACGVVGCDEQAVMYPEGQPRCAPHGHASPP
jgi:hypothetical protein